MAIEIGDNELQNIKKLEAELIDFQKLHVEVTGESYIQTATTRMAGGTLLYTQTEKRIDKHIRVLERYLRSFVRQNNIEGRLYGTKAMKTYLSKEEAAILTQKQLIKIRKFNKNQANQRLDVLFEELKKQAGILKSDIAIYKKNARAAGMSSKEILSDLVKTGKNKTGQAQLFAKKMKMVASTAALRERNAAKIAAYSEKVKPTALWQWITISIKPCPDCEARAGIVLKMIEWQSRGLPGAGATICFRRCYCQLIPWDVSKDLFPTVKVFDWNPKDLILTTPSDQRVFKALKNQPKQKVKI